MKVGQEVVLKARANPETTFHGKVVTIAPPAAKDEEGGRGQTVIDGTYRPGQATGMSRAEAPDPRR